MTRIQKSKHGCFSHSLRSILLVSWAISSTAFATGYFGPTEYFSSHQNPADASPEFYWALEVTRLAQEFRPPEKLPVMFTQRADAYAEENKTAPLAQATSDADLKDWAAALKEGRIKPPNPQEAETQHRRARDLIAATGTDSAGESVPAEFDSEFADYHSGALAFRRGNAHWEEARQFWEALLKRPASERHYRTVWATFMLGKIAMKTADYPAAIAYFQKTRALAQEGFADSLCMAADSFGWEGRCQWKQGHPEKAAPLFLTQLSLGDESAIVSLKALIPDRQPIDGMLNYGPEPEDQEKWSEQERAEAERKAQSALQMAAKDPVLRRLVTVHILATESSQSWDEETSRPKASARCAHWLEAIKKENLKKVQDAEYLGWVAYTSANYEEAARWLALAQSDTPAACWLRSKLQLRAGKLADAAKSMEKAWQVVVNPTLYVKANAAGAESEVPTHFEREYDGGFTFPECASGEFGMLRLARGEFVQALDVLYKGGLWTDAAFVAERVLTADELKAYVDQLPPAPATSGTQDQGWRARSLAQNLPWLLGRRLVREDRYAEAAKYMPEAYKVLLDQYAQALKDGADEHLPKEKRAKAWFTAAWLARYDGMELMGTEGAPDGFVSEGAFESTDIAQSRLKLKANKEETRRLEKNRIAPDVRYHYRIIAGALAMKAAHLLENNREELADVINAAGNWVKDRDDKLADRYYQMLEARCAQTEIGRAAIAKHWFVSQDGPWSSEQQSALEASHKKLGISQEQ